MAGSSRFSDFHAALTKAFDGDSARASDFLRRLDRLAVGDGRGAGGNSYGVVAVSGSTDRLTATAPGAVLNVLAQGSITATANKTTGTLILTVTGTEGATDAFRTFRFPGPVDVVSSGTSDIFHFTAGTGISLTPSATAPKGVEIACTVTVPGADGSLALGGGNYSLVNDDATPGNSKYYGTDGSGTKGFFDLPGGGGGLDDAFASLIVSGTGGSYNATGADTLTLTGGTDISVTRSGANVTIAFTGTIPTVPGTKNSVEVDSGDLQLVGDDASPGNSKYYGTNSGGTKGFYDLPSGGGGGGGEPKKAVRALDITPRHDSGCGDLQWRQLDLAQPNRPNTAYLPFFPGEDTYAQLFIPEMPANWDLGTITATFIWMHPATTTDFDVVWSCSARVVRDDDAVDADFGTAVNVTDTGGTTHDIYKSAATAAITPSGTAGVGASLFLQVARMGTDGADTMAVDAWLLAVVIEWGVT